MTPVVRFELLKLRTQWRARAVLLAALLGPLPVVLAIHAQSRPPKDSLFGRFALDNGFAMSLLVLGFAGQWALPLLTAVVAGDTFASEDQHGTWKTVLTRSTGRSRIFWAKVVVACGYAVAVTVVLALSTTAAAWVIVGHQPLVGLSGQTIEATSALRLVLVSWATMLPPVLGFTCLALLLSLWSRSPAVGVAAPVVLGLVMQLVGALGGVDPVRQALLTTPFESWHGLLTEPSFTGPLVQGAAVCLVWCALSLGTAYAVLRRRDITGG